MWHTPGVLRESVDDLERVARVYEDEQSPRLASVLWDLAWLHQRSGNPQMAEELAMRGRAVSLNAHGDNAGQEAFEAAQGTALDGFHERALFRLRQALELGFAAPGLEEDEAFARLRGTATFEAIVAEIGNRLN